MIEKELKKIYSLSKFGIKLGLTNTKDAIKALDLDLNSIFFIHIAGTNGKGSTAATLNSLLTYHYPDKNIALYTSPHLIKFNERIKVNNKEITNKEIIKISKLIFKKCKKIPLTFFEFTTLMALLYFKQKKVHYAVIETGMGGRLDATNILNSKISIITSIGMDHQEYLGNTLEKIALEKAGIFKKKSVVILSKTPVNKILKKEANKKTKNILEISKDFKYSINDDNTFNLKIPVLNKEFKKIRYKKIKNIKLNLIGEHQKNNAASAIMAFSIINNNFTSKSLKEALLNVNWPGRLQRINNIYIDVSHNLEGITETFKTIKKIHKENIYTICGFLKDKDYKSMLKIIKKHSKFVYLVPTTCEDRSLKIDDIKDIHGVFVCKSFKEAIKRIKNTDGIILFTGSLYNFEHIIKHIKEFKC